MKIKRATTSVSTSGRRSTKPGEAAGGQQGPSAHIARVELGNASAGDWIELWVAHIAAPQGSHRQGFGKSVKETNPRTEPYRQAIADACEEWHEEHTDGTPLQLDGHLEVRIDFYMPPPPKSDAARPYPNTAPDIDKLTRSTFDGVTRGKLWKDDARVVGMTVWEYFAPSLQETGVRIAVRKIA